MEYTTHKDAQAVLDFWFVDHGGDDWFSGSAAFDAKVSDRFYLTLKQAEHGELFEWRDTPQGRLAEIIVLDQFSRQLYRGSGDAFKNDAMALTLAQEAVAQGLDTLLNEKQQQFLYMPYMHSESLIIHEQALGLFRRLGEEILKFEEGHLALIKRFGRFPKRNAALDRTSTPDELAYIADTPDTMF